jgi:hypothetical protein
VAAALTVLLTLLVPLAVSPAAAVTAPDAGQFVPLSPARLINTSTGLGLPSALTHGTTVNFTVLGKGGVPATGVSTVMLHIYTNATDFGYVYAWPTGSARPASSTLASSPGDTSDNLAMTQVGTAGQVSFQSMSTNPADMTVDVEGYVTDGTSSTAGASYVPLTQTRVLATPTGIGGRSTPLTSSEPNGFWNFTILGKGGLPTTGVAAVVMNVSAGDTSTTDAAQLDVGTGGADPSFASAKTFTYPGLVADQLAVVAPDAAGRIALSTNRSVNVWIDVQGYYLSASAGGSGETYVPVDPTRIVDTRSGLGIATTLAANQTLSGASAVPITGVAGVPTFGVGAVTLSLTTEGAVGNGYDTLWAEGPGNPGTSTVAANAGMPNTNLAYVRPGTGGDMDVFSSDANDLLVDVEGYFVSTQTNGCTADPQVGVSAITTDGTLSQPVSGDGLGRQYTFLTPDGSTQTQTLPPLGWAPLTASDDELALFGFPPRPTDPADLSAWQQLAAAYRSSGEPGYCDSASQNPTSGATLADNLDADGPGPAGADSHFSVVSPDDAAPEQASSQESDNWAGRVNHGKTYTEADAGWYQTGFKSGCAAPSAYSTWSGLGGYGTSDLMQSGTSIDRNDNTPSIYAWWEILSDSYSINEQVFKGSVIHPGDAVDAETTYSAAHHTVTMSVFDQDTGVLYSTGSMSSYKKHPISQFYDGSTAEYITEAPTVNNKIMGLRQPNLGNTEFWEAGATAAGTLKGVNNWPDYRVHQGPSSNPIQTVSKLTHAERWYNKWKRCG